MVGNVRPGPKIETWIPGLQGPDPGFRGLELGFRGPNLGFARPNQRFGEISDFPLIFRRHLELRQIFDKHTTTKK